MPITLHQESADTYRLDISGVLLKSAYRQCETELKSELDRGDRRNYCASWTGSKAGSRTSIGAISRFYVKYGDAIQQIAIVGPERWRGEMLMFAAADLRKAPVEFFPEGELTRARAWLSVLSALLAAPLSFRTISGNSESLLRGFGTSGEQN